MRIYIVECNAGVYLTAIQPALEKVHEGWKADFNDKSVVCTKVSDRFDQSETHKVCTQLHLLISQKEDEAFSTKVVLHLYHTEDKVQVQGGPLLSSSMSSTTWIIQNLIEPLAASHIDSNQDLITDHRC